MVWPIGVFALVCKIAITTGFDAIRPLAWSVVTVLFALAFHAFVVIPSLLTVLGYKRPGVHFKTMIPAFLMAFSTASSAGTLPVTME
jgi:Na+/H+-dicarboxylate symporter